MQKKGVRSQGKTRIGEEECRCITLRMWGKKGKQKRRTDAEGRGVCIHTHTKKKKRREESRCRRKKNEDMQKNSCREVPVQK